MRKELSMTENTYYLNKQASAIVESLDKLDAKSLLETPSKDIALRYNEILAMAKSIKTSAEKGLWPPAVEIITTEMYGEVANIRFVELRAYAQQLVSAL
jgi:hypothetical protein